MKCKMQCVRHFGRNNASPERVMEGQARTVVYQKGETLFKQGAFANEVACISSGLLKIQLMGHKNNKTIVRISAPGELTGLEALTGQEVYACSAIAMKTTTLCLMQAGFIKQLMQRYPGSQEMFFSALGNSQRQLNDKIAQLSMHQTRGRLAQALLYLNQPAFVNEQIFNYITRKEIAALAGMSMESITKILRDFKQDGLIALQNGKIRLKCPNDLQELATRN